MRASATRLRSRGAQRPQCLVDLGAPGVELGGELVLEECLVESIGGLEPSAAGEVVLGGAEPGALEGLPDPWVGGILREDPRVLRHGAVVVLGGLGLLGGPQARGRCAASKAHDEHRERNDGPSRTRHW